MTRTLRFATLLWTGSLALATAPAALTDGVPSWKTECWTEADHATLLVDFGEFSVVSGEGGQRIQMPGSGHLMDPGKPLLPAKDFLVALPPGARVQSLKVEGVGGVELAGTYEIVPSPPILPLPDQPGYAALQERMLREWRRNNEAAYSTDEAYPKEIGRLTGSGSLRKYAYASVSLRPFRYHPQSGRLIRYDAAKAVINYTLPSPGSTEARSVEALKRDTLADERASSLFVNYSDIIDLYEPRGAEPKNTTHDFVIITTSALSSAVTSSDFVTWKASLGYDVRIVLTTDTEIASQPGADLAEQIRNFLRSYYGSWGIQYVLMVGSYASVPMRYCYPNPDDHTHNPSDPNNPGGSVPTDYYYADLSLSDADSWDSDGDGYPGEYTHDSPDFLAEVSVGRIPTSDTARITYTLNKLIAFEQDTGTWKNQALQPGAILFYENQDYNGYPKLDGATVLAHMQTDFMTGWSVSRYSEQEGLDPSDYPWPAVSESAFIGDWRDGQYGVVNWAGHGAPYAVGRVVWVWDDGDGVPETDGSDVMDHPYLISIWSDLDDDYPSVVFAVSCNVGYPEPNAQGNLGIDLLTEPTFGASAGIVSSSRPAWISANWPTSPGGAESICYEFNRYEIQEGERLGDALYDAKHYCHENYAWDHYAEHINLFNFNLYGDPSLLRTGDLTAVEREPSFQPADSRLSLRNYPNPFNPVTEIRYTLPTECRVRLDVFDVLGRKVATLADEHQEAGKKTIRWDATSLGGTEAPSGLYFCRLEAGDRVTIRKIVLMK